VHYPSTSTYTAFNSRRWSNTTILAPSCVILPESTNDVSLAVKTLVAGADGNATACQFAIKSGGHNPNPGANNMNGGIVLDLGHLNDTSISADRRTVRLGAGATWLHAYDTVPGVLFPGGACSGTGVGGVSLGGGMSVFLAEVGWVVNSVRNFELVLASGEVINANSTHHTALYKAMKGGGSNFGVLTHVDVEVMREGGLVYGGQVTHLATPDVTNQLLTNLTRYVKANNKDPKAGFQVAFLASDGVILADSLLVYSDPVAGAPILQPFLDIQPSLTNTMGMRNMSDITREVNALQPNGYR
jgi:FAD binding domain